MKITVGKFSNKQIVYTVIAVLFLIALAMNKQIRSFFTA